MVSIEAVRVPGWRRYRPSAGRASLEARFVAAALGAAAAALLTTFSLYQWSNWAKDRQDLAANAVTLGHAVASVAHRGLEEGDGSAAAHAAALLRGAPAVKAATYFHADGRRLDLGPDAAEHRGLRPTGVVAPRHDFRAPGVEVRAPHFVGGRRVGEVALVVDDDEIVAVRWRNILIALALSAAGAAGAGLLAQRLARRSLAPLRGLNAAIETAAASRDFTARVPVRRADEVGQLTRNFNRLQQALETYDASLKGALAEATAARDAAEQANALKSQILANMSHELRTPLNGVLGMAQILMLDELTPPQRARIEMIHSSGRALLSVLSDILDLSAIESGGMRLTREPFDLEAMIAEAALAARAASPGGVPLVVDVAPGARGDWLGDGERVRQVLFHLTANALKFTEAGEVTVRAATAADGGLELAVTDTGPGIAAHELPRLFESFVQGDGGATRRAGGAGLGLTICRSLTSMMGGAITVESTPGRGSTFHLRLPLRRPALAEAGAA
ncbi:sensor histidine kinase [Phenylobacterium sp.]|uniref:sensor histidine kinase n=1 Tax=Phenylobacterium sp. TaxID=1871053 RepID=UPI002FE1FADC